MLYTHVLLLNSDSILYGGSDVGNWGGVEAVVVFRRRRGSRLPGKFAWRFLTKRRGEILGPAA